MMNHWKWWCNMPAYKDDKHGTWFLAFYYTNWQGKRVKKMKRGFTTKREAQEWERVFLQQQTQQMDMTFAAFYELYKNDKKSRLKLNTWLTKETMINNRILPYFKDKKMNEIKVTDIIAWQNTMIDYRDKDGKEFSMTYKKSLHNQITALFNHAVKFYDLKANPASKAGTFGSEQTKEIQFWTQEEYGLFIDTMRDRPMSYYVFSLMYWTGLRTGELLALTPNDFDFEKKTLQVSKSYQRLQGKDVITPPKTKKSNRTININDTLCEEMQEYIRLQYKMKGTDRMFPTNKSHLTKEMKWGCTQSGVKRITLHSIRHSHISLLIHHGFSVVAIADRVGHKGIDITFRYAHLFPSKQIEMTNKLEELQNDNEDKRQEE